jgi:hypothetical protein
LVLIHHKAGARLNKSLYGLKQAGYNWFAKLPNGLIDQGFTQLNIDACVFFRKGCIILTYVDDCIMVEDSIMDFIEIVITLLNDGTKNFILQDGELIDNIWELALHSLMICRLISCSHFLSNTSQHF